MSAIIKRRPATVRHTLVVTSKERRFLADILLYCTERRALQQCLQQWFQQVNLFQPGSSGSSGGGGGGSKASFSHSSIPPPPPSRSHADLHYHLLYDNIHCALSETVNAPGNMNHTLIVAGGVELCVLLEASVSQIERYCLDQQRRSKTASLRQYSWHFIGPMLAAPRRCFSGGDLSQVGVTERQRRVKVKQDTRGVGEEWGEDTVDNYVAAPERTGGSEKDELLVGFDDGSAISRSNLLGLCQWDGSSYGNSSNGDGSEPTHVTFSRSGLYDENTAVLFGPPALGGTSLPSGSQSVSILTSDEDHHHHPQQTKRPTASLSSHSNKKSIAVDDDYRSNDGHQQKYFFGGAGRVAEVRSRLEIRFVQEKAMNEFLAAATAAPATAAAGASNTSPGHQPAEFLSFVLHMLERIDADEYEALAATARLRRPKSQQRPGSEMFYDGARYRDDVLHQVKSLCKGHPRFGPRVFQADEILRIADARVALSLEDCISEGRMKAALFQRWRTHLRHDTVEQIFAFASAMAVEGFALPTSSTTVSTPPLTNNHQQQPHNRSSEGWAGLHASGAPWAGLSGGATTGLRVTVLRSHASTLLETKDGIILVDGGDEASFKKYVWPYLKDKTHFLKLVVATQPSILKIGGLVLLYRHIHHEMSVKGGPSSLSAFGQSPTGSAPTAPLLLMQDYLSTSAPVSYAHPRGVIAAQELVAIAKDLGVLEHPSFYTSKETRTTNRPALAGTGKPINAAGVTLTPFTTGQDGPSFTANYTAYHRATDSRLLLAASPLYDDVLPRIPTTKKISTTTDTRKQRPATPRSTRGAITQPAVMTTVELPPFDLAIVPPVASSLIANALSEMSLSGEGRGSCATPKPPGTPRTQTYTKKSESRGAAATSPLLNMIPMAAVYVGNALPFPAEFLASYCTATRNSAAYCFQTPQDRFQTLPQEGEGEYERCRGEVGEGGGQEEKRNEEDMYSPNPRCRPTSGGLSLPQGGENQVQAVPLDCVGMCWSLSSAMDSGSISHYEPTFLMSSFRSIDISKKMASAGGGAASPRSRRTVSPVRALPRRIKEETKAIGGESNKKPARKRFAGLDAFNKVPAKEEARVQGGGHGGGILKKESPAVAPAVPVVEEVTSSHRSPTRGGHHFSDSLGTTEPLMKSSGLGE